jgi:hypothetical protein
MQFRHCMRVVNSQLRRCALVSSAALLPVISQAGPLVIEEVARITSPDPSYTSFGAPVAVDGNSIIVGGGRPTPNPEFPDQFDRTAFLFERNSAGQWVFVRTLATIPTAFDAGGDVTYPFNVAMSGGVASVASGQILVFERTASGWVSVPAVAGAQNGDLEVSSGLILASSIVGTCFDADLVEKQASGTWLETRSFVSTVPPGTPSECDVDSSGGEVDITNNRVILGHGAEVQIWHRNANGTWPIPPSAIVPLPPPVRPPNFSSGTGLTIEDDLAIASSGSRVVGPVVLRRSGSWTVTGNLHRPDSAVLGPPGSMELLNGIAPVSYGADIHRSDSIGSVAVFQRNSSGNFDYVAELVTKDRSSIGSPEISGRRIVVSGFSSSAAYVFELPADLSQPALIQDDFEDRNVAEWTHIPGSTVSVVQSGSSFVYRQTNLAGDAGSTRTNVDMKNQSIEADVVPRAFATGTGERWFGLTVRQTDPGNFYYLTVRNNNVVSLRKLQNGAINVLASANLPVVLNRPYKLRLEAIGTRIRGYVDGQLRVQASDTRHTHGTPGIRMFRARTDYDNVVISPNPHTVLFRDDFEGTGIDVPQWFTHDGTWTNVASGTGSAFRQTSTTGDARVTTGVDATDQAIQVRARANSFAGGTGDRWFGLLARMRDINNYYYLTVRNTNTVSLRKLVNGSAVVLDTATLTVTPGTTYTLRLEAVGSALRAYVNGRLLLEAIDSSYAEGEYGLVTFRTNAQYDDVVVTQP